MESKLVLLKHDVWLLNPILVKTHACVGGNPKQKVNVQRKLAIKCSKVAEGVAGKASNFYSWCNKADNFITFIAEAVLQFGKLRICVVIW